MKSLIAFFRDDEGAVTVDWVVLTGAVVALSALVGTALKQPVNDKLEQIAQGIENS